MIMNTLKNTALVFFSIILSIVLLEFSLRLVKVELPLNRDHLSSPLFLDYTKEELDNKKMARHPNHGGNCVKKSSIKKMQWNPRFGWNDNDVNIDCINTLFNEGKKNIVFMGGSAMANYSLNYLTTIENYLFLNDNQFRSINLAESGARLSNELAIFVEYIPKLKKKPDLIVFFDGYNEFNSVRYGGNPIDDFYWSVGVKYRVHSPFKYYMIVLAERYEIFRLVYNKILGLSSSRIQPNFIDNKKIIEAANHYTYSKSVLKNLCDVYKIDYIFVLQPVFVLSKNLNSKIDIKIKKWHDKYFKNDEKVYRIGYSEIIKSNNDIRNLTNIFDNNSGIYFDGVHTNKVGAKIIGKNLRKIIFEKFNMNN